MLVGLRRRIPFGNPLKIAANVTASNFLEKRYQPKEKIENSHNTNVKNKKIKASNTFSLFSGDVINSGSLQIMKYNPDTHVTINPNSIKFSPNSDVALAHLFDLYSPEMTLPLGVSFIFPEK